MVCPGLHVSTPLNGFVTIELSIGGYRLLGNAADCCLIWLRLWFEQTAGGAL